MRGVKFVGAEFLAGGIWNVFACVATTIDPMYKRRPWLNSAQLKGAITPLQGLFDNSGGLQQGGEICWVEFFARRIWNIFACVATTIDAMDKRTSQLDSAHQIGPGRSTHEFPDCSGDALIQGESLLGGILNIRILELFLLMKPQPVML